MLPGALCFGSLSRKDTQILFCFIVFSGTTVSSQLEKDVDFGLNVFCEHHIVAGPLSPFTRAEIPSGTEVLLGHLPSPL